MASLDQMPTQSEETFLLAVDRTYVIFRMGLDIFLWNQESESKLTIFLFSYRIFRHKLHLEMRVMSDNDG